MLRSNGLKTLRNSTSIAGGNGRNSRNVYDRQGVICELRALDCGVYLIAPSVAKSGSSMRIGRYVVVS